MPLDAAALAALRALHDARPKRATVPAEWYAYLVAVGKHLPALLDAAAERDRLALDCKGAEYDAGLLRAELDEVTAERDRLKQALDACQAALRKYGQHQQGCRTTCLGYPVACRCGLDATLSPTALPAAQPKG